VAKKLNHTKYTRRPKQGVWFVAVRGSYLPANLIGWLTYLPFIGYITLSTIIAVRNTTSLVVAIFFIVPSWVAAGAIMTWLAVRKS
jgi:hypothetical protein